MCFHFPRSRNSLPDPEEVTMSIDRTELADALAEATGWSVTTDPHRVTFTNDEPPQVVIWTVTDSEIGQLMYNENRRAQGYGGKRTADLGALWLPPPHGSAGPVRRLPRIYGRDRRDRLRVILVSERWNGPSRVHCSGRSVRCSRD